LEAAVADLIFFDAALAVAGYKYSKNNSENGMEYEQAAN
jgi:hypothetical protein